MLKQMLVMYRLLTLPLLLATLLTGIPVPGFSQSNNKIRYLGIEHGLSNNSVRCIYQDRSGFMWIGTYAGLNRFDGSEFKIFRNKPNDSSSLVHNYIFSIYEDANALWVATGQGLVSMNRIKSSFTLAKFYPHNQGLQDLTMSTNCITGDKQGNLFICTNDRGFLVKKANEKYARQVNYKVAGGMEAVYSVSSAVYSNNNLWLSVINNGLCKYDLSKNSITPIESSVKVINCMLADQDGNIWVGAENGLYKYDVAAGAYTKHYTQASGELPLDVISSLHINQGQLWIGTEGGGIAILNLTNGQFRYVRPGKGPGTLSSEAVYSITSDTEGRIWIGTHKGGCDIIDETSGRFNTIANNPFNNNSLVSNFVYSFCETKKDGDIIIGTDGGGLSIWDRAGNSFKNYTHQPGNNHSLSHNAVTSIATDHEGAIWVSTLGGGVNRFNKNTGSFEHYKCINDSTGIENRMVLNIFEDSRKTLWATSFGKLYQFNRQANRFQVYSQEINDPISIVEDRSGVVWTGNSSQLIKLDPATRQQTFFLIGKPVRAINEDSKGNFWLGTEGGGLVLFDRKAGNITKRFTDADGLCSNSVLNILEDSKGYLWMSTFYGLSRFDPSKNAFRNFYQSDGLQSNQFNYRAAYKLSTGEMLFGGINGFNIFYPDSIVARSYMPQTHITDLFINSKSLAEVGNKYLKPPSNQELTALTVPYSDAILSIQFNAIEFSSPEKISYAYYLKGWDRNWIYSGNTKTINYNNLREGNYTLYVKNTNAAGVWNQEKAVLQIEVLPPWYRSWWAYSLYTLLIAGAIWLYLRYKRKQTQMAYEVKLAHLEAEKEKELNEKKLNFFTNVSHEFRTPLTLIINPVKDLLYGNNKQVDTGELNVVYRNARRLLSLVDQLLLFRKADVDEHKLRVSKLVFSDLCYEVYLCFTKQAASKNIQYEFEPDETRTELYLDNEKIEIALFNLLSNALKYTQVNGMVKMAVSAAGGMATVAVTDNGPGISEERRKRLFERFYQAKEVAGQTGFGIGLFVAKTFVTDHKGTITHENLPAGGSQFTIQLLEGQEHFPADTVFEDSSKKSPILEELVEENDAENPLETLLEKKVENALSELVTEEKVMLVVDDDEQIRQYLRQIFGGQFRIHAASSAEEALPMARQFTPDIVISDVVMKEMTGIELCNAIKTDPQLSHVPVILLTASSAADIKLKGIEYGADDYITKPFEKSLLMARVNNLLRTRNSLQNYFFNEITLKENHIKISAEDKEFLERCMEIVEENLERDDFNIQTLASEIGMSHSTLYKRIKSISGQTANAFIRFIRLRKAAGLMINSEGNVSEIAFQVGIADPRYFRDQFNQLFGMNPSDYIRKYRKPFQKKFNLNENASRPEA